MREQSLPTDSIFEKTIRYSFYTLFFLTPLILWTKTSEVFEFNKMLFVYLVTAIISSAWLLKSARERKFTLRRTPLDIPILIFLTSQIISTVLSIDPHTSFWGYYSRFHGGLASTISYILLYYAFVTHFSGKPKSVSNIIYTILVSSLVVSLYGILERAGIDKHIWVQDVQNRVFSTLGQPNWLSAYLIAILPISLFYSALSKDRLGSFIFGSLTFIILITILFTKSRSGIGATAIIVSLSFLYVIFQHAKSRQLSSTLFLLALSLIISIIFIGTPWTPTPREFQKSHAVGGPLLPNLEKYINKIGLSSQIKPVDTAQLTTQEKWQFEQENMGIRVGGSDSMDIRKVVWQGAIELGQRYPLFGPGVETFAYTYYWVRPAAHNLLSEWDFLYNKAHNEYLNFLATTGFFGLFSYLLLITWTLIWWLKNIDNMPHVGIGLFLGYLSILITNFFGFSVVNIALFFFLFPAIALLLSNQPTGEILVKIKYPTFVTASAVFLILFLPAKIFTLWTSDIAFASGKAFSQYGPEYLSSALESLSTAVKANKKEPLYKSILAESQAQAAMYLAQQIEALPATTSAQTKNQYIQARDEFISAAQANSQEAITMNPYHTNYYKSRAKVGLYLSMIDPAYYSDVITSLLKLSQLAPTDAKILYNIGLVYMSVGKNEEAKLVFQKAVELKPDYEEAKAKLELK